MAYQQKDMEGSLFRNAKKEKDSHPSMEGSCTIGGVKYWISAWTNEGTGDKGRWQALKFKRADAKKAASTGPAQEDDIPA